MGFLLVVFVALCQRYRILFLICRVSARTPAWLPVRRGNCAVRTFGGIQGTSGMKKIYKRSYCFRYPALKNWQRQLKRTSNTCQSFFVSCDIRSINYNSFLIKPIQENLRQSGDVDLNESHAAVTIKTTYSEDNNYDRQFQVLISIFVFSV